MDVLRKCGPAGMSKQPSQFEVNQQIEALINHLDATSGKYSEQDKVLIARYSGSGGLGSKGASGQGTLYEYYTPDYIAEIMWELAREHGYESGPILEPSIGSGKLIAYAPKAEKVVGFEVNKYSARIAEILYPNAIIHRGYFETAFLGAPRFRTRMKGAFTWLEEYPFSLVIGNPPYGIYRNLYSSYFKSPKLQTLEIFFLYYGLKMLRQGGLLVYLLPSQFMRNGNKYDREKGLVSEMADIVDAYRLPPVFPRSQVPVDILILRKK